MKSKHAARRWAQSVRKSTAFVAVAALIAYALLEVSAFAGLAVLARTRGIAYQPILTSSVSDEHRTILTSLLAGAASYRTYSANLGWTIKPNGNLGPYRANSQGIRGDEDYRSAPEEGVVRALSFGDSFTHGDDVENHDTWQAQMKVATSNMEILNFGVGGYGLDQAFLRYQQEGSAFESDIVLIGYMTENILRHVNVFRPFYYPQTTLPLTKPTFAITENDGLTLFPNPIQTLTQYSELLDQPEAVLPMLGVNDFYFQTSNRAGSFDFLPSVRLFKMIRWELSSRMRHTRFLESWYDPESEAFRLTVHLFDRFVTSVKDQGSLPVILVFPKASDLRQYRFDQTKVYSSLLAELDEKGYLYIDLMDVFTAKGNALAIDDLVPSHYSPHANKLVAHHIVRRIQEHLPQLSSRDPTKLGQPIERF